MMWCKGGGREREGEQKSSCEESWLKIQTHAHYNTAGKKLCADRKITKVKQGAKEPSFLSRRSRKWGMWLTQTFDILSSTKRFHEGVKEVLGVIQGLLIFMHDLRKYKIKTQLTVKFFLFTVCEPSSFVPFCDVLILLFETNKRQKTYAHRKSLPPPPSLIVCPLDDHLQIRIAFRDEMAEWLKVPAPNWGSFAVLEGFNFITNCKLSFVDFWGCSQSHLLKMMSLFVSVLP